MASLPVGPGFAYWDPLDEEPGYRSETLSGTRRFRSRGFKRWRIACGWRDLTTAEAKPIIAFLRARGEREIFQVANRPDGLDPDRTLGRVDGAHASGETTIATSSSLFGRVDAGHKITFADDAAEHTVSAVTDDNITLTAATVAALADDTKILSVDRLLPVRLVGPLERWNYQRGGLWNIDIELVEELL